MFNIIKTPRSYILHANYYTTVMGISLQKVIGGHIKRQVVRGSILPAQYCPVVCLLVRDSEFIIFTGK